MLCLVKLRTPIARVHVYFSRENDSRVSLLSQVCWKSYSEVGIAVNVCKVGRSIINLKLHKFNGFECPRIILATLNLRILTLRVLIKSESCIIVDLPRPLRSKLMLLYPPPPMLSSSRSRHSIVVLNSYDDDPNIVSSRLLKWVRLYPESVALFAPLTLLLFLFHFLRVGAFYTWQHFLLPSGMVRAFAGLVRRPIGRCVIWFLSHSSFALLPGFLMDFLFNLCVKFPHTSWKLISLETDRLRASENWCGSTESWGVEWLFPPNTILWLRF